MPKESLVFVAAAPRYAQIYRSGKPVRSFTVADVAAAKLYYKLNPWDELGLADTVKQSDAAIEMLLLNYHDYAVVSFVAANGSVHCVLLMFEFQRALEGEDSLLEQASPWFIRGDNERSVRGYNDRQLKEALVSASSLKSPPRKTIIVHPGESIKLTTSELKPKGLGANVNLNRLVYFLVSGAPKYGSYLFLFFYSFYFQAFNNLLLNLR